VEGWEESEQKGRNLFHVSAKYEVWPAKFWPAGRRGL